MESPEWLYKVLSVEDFEAGEDPLKLSSMDRAFIHFSTEDQLERIISKFWKNVPCFYVLKIDPQFLPGDLVFETNPGGSAKYYHLYNGAIPQKAILEVTKVSKE